MIKKMVFLVMVVFIAAAASNVYSQDAEQIAEKDVPLPVKNNFYERYTSASNVKWTFVDNTYEAAFVDNKFDKRITLGPVGEFLLAEIEVDPETLPEPILMALSTHHPGSTIRIATVMEDEESRHYRIDFTDKLNRKLIRYYNVDGTIYQIPYQREEKY